MLLLCVYVDAAGMAITAIDTPGLHASADAQSANRSLLRGIKAAWKKHKPNFLIYVDRWVLLGVFGGGVQGKGGFAGGRGTGSSDRMLPESCRPIQWQGLVGRMQHLCACRGMHACNLLVEKRETLLVVSAHLLTLSIT
jgi:hypothetical protein